MKNLFCLLLLTMLTAFGTNAQRSAVFATNGKAIKGYDVVAFFKEGKPVKGKDSITYMYESVQWLFSSKENLATFKADPTHYIPQYGGYCAYGTAEGHKAPTQTETWTIVNNKLYFNYNAVIKETWSKNQEAFIQKADQYWPVIKDKE